MDVLVAATKLIVRSMKVPWVLRSIPRRKRVQQVRQWSLLVRRPVQGYR